MNRGFWILILLCLIAIVIMFLPRGAGASVDSVGCTCVTKDPHDYVPGWEDSKVELGNPYFMVILRNLDGERFFFFNTSPGWYATPDGSNIDYVVWCGD